MQAAASDRASVPERWPDCHELRRLRRIVTKRLWTLDRIVGDAAQEPVLELVVLERSRLDPRPLFEHHHRKAGPRQFSRHHAASGPGPDDGEVDGLGVPIRSCAHFDDTGSAA